MQTVLTHPRTVLKALERRSVARNERDDRLPDFAICGRQVQSSSSIAARGQISARSPRERRGGPVAAPPNSSISMVAGARSGPSAETVLGFRLRGASLKFRTFYLISCSTQPQPTATEDDLS